LQCKQHRQMCLPLPPLLAAVVMTAVLLLRLVMAAVV
jgi:hypothetical protein